jgi:acyl carrier protein
MDLKKRRVLEEFCNVVNRLKRTSLCADEIDAQAYLGCDLGIDSIEMLEIWYDLEQRLSVSVDDAEKRNIYTIDEALGVVAGKL